MIWHPKSRIEWQRTTILAVVIGSLLISFCQGLIKWPELPVHRVLLDEKYAERMSLLKYFVSLGFAAIAATWYVACNAKPRQHIFQISVSCLSWAWTCLGISLLSCIVEIYQTYKDHYYWRTISIEGYASELQKFQHSVSLHLLHLTYSITDYLFFTGWVLLILAMVGTGRKTESEGDLAAGDFGYTEIN